MKILLLHRQHTAVGYYRTLLPSRILTKLGHEVTVFDGPYERVCKPNLRDWVTSNLRKWDLVIVDRALRFEELGFLLGLRHNTPGMRMIVDFDDDFIQVPNWNKSWKEYQPAGIFYETGCMHLRGAEYCTVSTAQLAANFAKKTHAIRVAPNLIDPADWSVPGNPDRGSDRCLRVLYGGADGHFGDLDPIREGIQAVVEKPPVPWRLICFGSMPFWLHDLQRAYPERVVNLNWVPFFEGYPQAIAWGGFDAALAPLAEHPFNECKSNIKWLEAGMQGIPLLCSNVGPYAAIPQGCAVRVQNTPVQWAEGLRSLLEDASWRQRIAEDARTAVLEGFTLDRGMGVWQTIVSEAMERPRIECLEDTRLPA